MENPVEKQQQQGNVPNPVVKQHHHGSVPDVSDTTLAKPEPGKLRISQEAIERRMRRVFTPNVKGEYKVSAEIVQQWKSKKSRKSLEKIFQSVGFNTEMGCKQINVS